MQLIPASASEKKVPCRFIKLNEAGETIDSLYRYGNHDELEAALTKWLKDAIQKLETEKSPASGVCRSTACQRKCKVCVQRRT